MSRKCFRKMRTRMANEWARPTRTTETRLIRQNGDRARERITNLADNVMASANVRCERANPSNLTSDEPDEFSRRR